tara:strand:- start:208 stop:435 length:228 start_codon:yes stop_codon:yes gene_type:complete
MPKGVKYNYKVILPREQEIRKENKTMIEMENEINKIILEHYFIDNSINKSKLFNLMKRPKMVNKFLKQRVICWKI